jgi:hypothetical protein
MMAADELSPEEVVAELQAANVPLTAGNLQAMVAKARAHEHEAEQRRMQWPLLGLIPSSVNAEVARRAADQGVLIAERIGGRWFCTVSDMENWLKRTGRWFRSEAEEQRWRKMLVDRRIQ